MLGPSSAGAKPQQRVVSCAVIRHLAVDMHDISPLLTIFSETTARMAHKSAFPPDASSAAILHRYWHGVSMNSHLRSVPDGALG